MSPISWLRRVCSLLRDHKKKGITEWHNLIMHLGVSPRVLRHFGNLCIPHYDLALCLFSPRLPFSTSLFRFSPASLSFGLSFPASRIPFPVLSLIPSAPSLVSLSSLAHLCLSTPPLRFTPPLLPALVLGQVADQLAYYIRVSETAIAEETFDAAVQSGAARGDPTPQLSRMTCLRAPLLACLQHILGKGSIKDDNTTNGCRWLAGLTGGYLGGGERDSSEIAPNSVIVLEKNLFTLIKRMCAGLLGSAL